MSRGLFSTDCQVSSAYLFLLSICLSVHLPASLQVHLSFWVASSQHVTTELICELLLDLFDLSGLAVVSQCPGHFLVGHLLAVAFLHSPAVGQNLFVFGGELESSLFFVHPPDAVLHVSVSQKVQQELIQTNLLLVS